MSLVDYITTEGTRQITSTQFAIMSPEKIIEQSVAHIYNHIGKHKGDNSSTLLDPRLGAGRGQVNVITGLSQKLDPGNFGHCVLAKPVYHPMFFDHVKRIVSSVCIVCSALRYSSDEEKEQTIRDVKGKNNRLRFAHVTGMLSSREKKFCYLCSSPYPAIRENKSTLVVIGLQAIFNKSKEAPKDLNPEHVYRILRGITDENCETMGLNPKTSRPEWMMITVLPVPPPSMRPSVQVENGKVSEDDMTHAFNNIIKQNNSLQLNLLKVSDTANDITIHKLWQGLQLIVACMIDNETSSYSHATNRTHRPLKTIRKRHRGKQGRIRWNLMGKRVNSSARSVITADPNLSINQVGVPERIAMNLTYPEIVTSYNFDHLSRLVKNGPSVYPGAKNYRAKNSKFRKDLAINDNVTLNIGDTVYRHMLDGDIVFFNRQPSLHKMSMMAHHAKIMPGLSFRLNPNDTTPYNADFDGDEMNLHLPQSVQTAEEISRLAMVSTQVVSPQASKPIIGLVQDSLLGTYRMSSEHIRGFTNDQRYYMNPRQFMRLVVWLNNYIGIMPTPSLEMSGRVPVPGMTKGMGWTTRQLINMFLPHVSLRNVDEKKGTLIIKNGVLLEPEHDKPIAPIGKEVVGKGAGGGLIHICWNDLGPSATRDLLDNLSKLSSQYLLTDGFSVGLSDVEIKQSVLDTIETIKDEYLEGARELIEGLHMQNYDETRDRIIKQPRGLAKNDLEQFENDIMYYLGECKSKIEKLTVDNLTSVHADNRIRSMVDSGSKGSSANVVQIVAGLGQQDIGGKRIPNSYLRRPFPHVPKDDLSPEARGFCRSSYIEGLSPIEYITHAMAGRIGVISTSIKTAESGYIQRKLVKILEDLMITYDGTVRNPTGMIVQSLYGGDGFDGSRIEPQRIDHLTMAHDEFQVTYKYSETDLEDLKIMMTPETYARFTETFDAQMAAIRREYEQIEQDRKLIRATYLTIPKHFMSPVNFMRMIKHTSFRLGMKANKPSDLTPMEIIEQVDETLRSLKVSENEKINNVCTRNIRAMMRCFLHSKKLMFSEKFTQEALNYLLIGIKVKFNDALASPGEAVGPIAAQSIGEPSTQLTLDTFHHAGIGAKANVSRGVPRLKEVMSLASKPKTPAITTYLNPSVIRNLKIGNRTVDEMDQELRASFIASGEMEKQERKEKQEKLKAETQQHVIKIIKKIKSEYDYVTFKDIVRRIEVIYDENDTATAITADQAFITAFWDICKANEGDMDASPWVLRFELDSHKLADHNIQLYHIEHIFNSDQHLKNNVQCIFSDDNSETLVCRARIIDVGANPSLIIDSLESVLLNKKIKGVPGIAKTSIRMEKADVYLESGAIISQYDSSYTEAALSTIYSEQYVIDTVGSNLLEILNMPYVDTVRTISNNIYEIFDIYGVEGARQIIIDEIMEVMEYAGASIGRRHVELLADIMTTRGILQSVDRFGVKKGETGPWARASFEETTPHMIQAAVFGEVDNMKGVSANVLFGQFMRVGTNSFTVGLDESLISKMEPIKEEEEGEITIANMTNELDLCEDSNFEFNFDL